MTDHELIEWRLKLQNFLQRLHTPPKQEEIRANQFAGNTLYLPISYIEMSLDELFFGLWETKDFKWQTMANEIVGSITLRVFHPVANQWIERTGASATMIRQQKGAGITDLNAKIHNALEMDFPHLKSDCIVNAAKSFGKSFGRDLNRLHTDLYRPLITGQAIQNGAVTPQIAANNELAKALSTANELLERIRVDDQTLQSFTGSLMTCETPAEVWKVCEMAKQYLPVDDPAQQFGRMQNALNGTNKHVSTPSK
jgi:hypothetical protein